MDTSTLLFELVEIHDTDDDHEVGGQDLPYLVTASFSSGSLEDATQHIATEPYLNAFNIRAAQRCLGANRIEFLTFESFPLAGLFHPETPFPLPPDELALLAQPDCRCRGIGWAWWPGERPERIPCHCVERHKDWFWRRRLQTMREYLEWRIDQAVARIGGATSAATLASPSDENLWRAIGLGVSRFDNMRDNWNAVLRQDERSTTRLISDMLWEALYRRDPADIVAVLQGAFEAERDEPAEMDEWSPFSQPTRESDAVKRCCEFALSTILPVYEQWLRPHWPGGTQANWARCILWDLPHRGANSISAGATESAAEQHTAKGD